MAEYYLAEVYRCKESGKDLITAGFDHIRKIIESSKRRHDDIHLDLEKNLTTNTNLAIYCHRDCVPSYTSSYHINRYLKRTRSSSSSNEPLPTKRTRSDIKQFEFRKNCLLCDETCALIANPRHPDRWRKAVLCRTADRPGRQPFKEAILKACGSRKDEWARQVSDLHAADARYHDD